MKDRSIWERAMLAVVLPGVAGAVNAIGFFAVGTYTSHVTGSLARVGHGLAQQDLASALHAAWLCFSFFLGAVAAAALVEFSRSRRGSAFYAAPLCLEAILFGWVGLATAHWMVPEMHGTMITLVLCFAMGLQNALVTRISRAVVRTTHVTGLVTDLGIEVVQLVGWVRRRLRQQGAGGIPAIASEALSCDELHPIRLHASVLGSFFLGAVAGPILFVRYGALTYLAPCGVLVLLAAFDLRVGFGSRRVPTMS